MLADADAPADATYGNFTSDRIFRSPTDLNWIIGRVLVLNDNDTTKAYSYSGNITLSPYNTAGEATHHTQTPCVSTTLHLLSIKVLQALQDSAATLHAAMQVASCIQVR